MTRQMVAAIVLGLALTGTLAGAQAPEPGRGQGQGRRGGGPPPPPPANLQVLPKDWTRQQVVTVMQQFNQALGVTCNHCHVFNGPGDPTNDFATDMKPTKNVARAMMRLATDFNTGLRAAVNKPEDQLVRVSCAMCHRGAATPVVPPPPAPAAAPGAPGAPGPGRGN